MSNLTKELEQIQKNRELILIVETMGNLHDIGKLSKDLFETKHHLRYEEDKNNGKVPLEISNIFERYISNFSESITQGLKLLGITNEITIANGIKRHHVGKKDNGGKSCDPKNEIEKIIDLSDNKDSSEDRGKAIRSQDKCKECIASVFGIEKPMLKDNFEYDRIDLYEDLKKCFKSIVDINENSVLFKPNLDYENLYKFRSELINILYNKFGRVTAETRRSANDVTLFDHSYMTGSIAKALLAKAIMNPNIISNFKPTTSTQHFESALDLDLLMFSFNGFGFISKGERLIDIIGRNVLLYEIKRSIKILIEVKYPIGNCIYEDENNLCFLISPLNKKSFEFIKTEILNIVNNKSDGLIIPVVRKSLKPQKYFGTELIKLKREGEKLSKINYIEGNIKLNWIHEWTTDMKRDKCVICGKLPRKDRRSTICSLCNKIRFDAVKRIKEFESKDTPWLDEIADENGKIALIVGVFQSLDEWLRGKLLEYQKIRTLEDISKATKVNIGCLPTFKDVVIKFIDTFREELSSKTDFMNLLRFSIGGIRALNQNEKAVLGYSSRVGELYFRLSEETKNMLKSIERSLTKNEKEKIVDELVSITTTKPSSPARLYRIWRELYGFSVDMIKSTREKMPYCKRLCFTLADFKNEEGIYMTKIPLIGQIEIFFDGKKFYTIERIDKDKASDEVKGDELKELEGKYIELIKDNKIIGTFKVGNITFEEYRQFREILASPNGFLFVVPANKVVGIARKIEKEFKTKFSKVLGNISLNIGVIYSYRKFPIYIALDSVRRMIEEFKQFDFEKVDVIDKNGTIVNLKTNNKKFRLEVSDKLGDGKEDCYYPYFNTMHGIKHIREINSNEKLKIVLNRFDFEFLDSSTRRFDIILNKNKKREHFIIGEIGPRPYLLEDLEKFERLREIFEKIGSWTLIKDIETLTANTREEWLKYNSWDEIKKNYEKFVDATLENRLTKEIKKKLNWNDDKKFLKECILEGIYYDAIEIFHRIMKIELE